MSTDTGWLKKLTTDFNGHLRLYGTLRNVESNRRFGTTYPFRLKVVLGLLDLLKLRNHSRREGQVAPKRRTLTSPFWTA